MSIGMDEHLTDSGQTAPRPSAEICEAVSLACQRLFAMEPRFIADFHTALLQLVPTLAHTTPDGGRGVSEGLARAVLWAALTQDPPDVIEGTFQNVGAEYSRKGFPDDGYHGAGHALLRAARSCYTGDWSSSLSSGWVAYYNWLSAHLLAGAQRERRARTDLAPVPATRPAADRDGCDSLEGILHVLRERHFGNDERALGAILTRVALRTGADLRAPRADQRTDPAVIANVLATLQVMGYVVTATTTEQTAGQTAGQYPPAAAVTGSGGVRWWNRRRDVAGRSRRRAASGLFQ